MKIKGNNVSSTPRRIPGTLKNTQYALAIIK